MTLDDLARMIKEGGDFVVKDAKTGEDLTRSVLTQIIVEQEQKGQNLLPISFLRQLIGFYGDNMQFLVPGYLEQAMKAFARNQEQMRSNLRTTFGMFPFGQFEEIGKQNMAHVRTRAAHAVARRPGKPPIRPTRQRRTQPSRRRPSRRTRGCAGWKRRSRRCDCSSKRWAAAATKAEGPRRPRPLRVWRADALARCIALWARPYLPA